MANPTDGISPRKDISPPRITPGPSGQVAFNANTHTDPLGFLASLIEQYGDVVRYRTSFGPCFVFVHPQHVQSILHNENYRRASLVKMMLGDGLLASDGTHWRSQRRLMQRDFLQANVAPFVPVMTAETAAATGACEDAAGRGEAVDVTATMTRLTLRIVVKALFGDDLSEPQTIALCEAITQTINDLSKISWTIFGVPVRFSPGSNASFAAAKGVIDATCYEMIARRRAQPAEKRPRDLLTLLIEAEGEEANDKQLRDEMVTMLVGGHETTALALAWVWKVLAEHPAIEARLEEEVDGVLGERLPTLGDMAKLTWTRSVFQEAMRLYPPVWYMARVASEGHAIDGHAIPKGAAVLISAYFTHRHKDFWAEPERFDPERFVNEEIKPSHRYAYFPFGGGRHQCLGMYFAMIEGTLILAQLKQRFRIHPVSGQEVRPDPGITLRQTPAMRARVEVRKCQ